MTEILFATSIVFGVAGVILLRDTSRGRPRWHPYDWLLIFPLVGLLALLVS